MLTELICSFAIFMVVRNVWYFWRLRDVDGANFSLAALAVVLLAMFFTVGGVGSAMAIAIPTAVVMAYHRNFHRSMI